MIILLLLHAQLDKLHQMAAILLSPGSIFSLPALAVSFTLAVMYLALRQRRRRGRVRAKVILRALARSRHILSHRSTYADLLYFGINTLAISTLIGWGMVSGFGVSHAVVRGLVMVFGARAPATAPEWALRATITFIAFIGYELGYYIDHYCKHKIMFLWEFHKTHHSAQTLTPLTVFRVHPVDTLIFVDVVAVCAGLMHGIFTYVAGRQVDIFLLANGNVISVVFILLLAQLQHSQFWMPLRGLPGRILLSPAHHQIHHSIAPEHYNCNLGSFLAIWDWLFGTLALPPARSPHLRFGVADGSINPHRLESLLVSPIVNAISRLRPCRVHKIH